MSGRCRAVAVLVACAITPATADPLGDTSVTAEAHFGLATVPFDVMALPEAKGQALVLVLGGAWSVAPSLALEVRSPLVAASVAQPAGSYVDAAAFGNPQLGAAMMLSRRPVGTGDLTILGGAAVGLPLGGHDEQLLANRALAIANGIDGLAHPDLFTPGVGALTPRADVRWASSTWSAALEARLPLLVRVSDAGLAGPQAETHAFGLAAVLAGDVRHQLTRRLALAVAPQLAIDARPIAAHPRDVSRLQDLERASLYIAIGRRTHLAVDVQGAIGGELGGSMVALGLRCGIDLR